MGHVSSPKWQYRGMFRPCCGVLSPSVTKVACLSPSVNTMGCFVSKCPYRNKFRFQMTLPRHVSSLLRRVCPKVSILWGALSPNVPTVVGFVPKVTLPRHVSSLLWRVCPKVSQKWHVCPQVSILWGVLSPNVLTVVGFVPKVTLPRHVSYLLWRVVPKCHKSGVFVPKCQYYGVFCLQTFLR